MSMFNVREENFCGAGWFADRVSNR